MSQHDYVIDDQAGLSFLNDLNANLAAIVTNNSAAAEPTTKYPFQWWADTATNILKMRNAANNAWISMLDLTTGASFAGTFKDNAFTLQDNSDATKQALFELSAITAGQTRTFNLPDQSGTLALLSLLQTYTKSQRGTVTVDNDGSFDMNVTNNFKCTPTAIFTLTFTNIAEGQSGYIYLINTGGYAISKHSAIKCGATLLSTISAAGTYLLSYFTDGTDVVITGSQAVS